MPYVITCGDEGIQVNLGTRLGVVGAGIRLDGFSQIVKALKKVLNDDQLRIAANAENDWVKQQFSLDSYEQADATMQQHAEATADVEKLLYVGFMPFSDPKELKHEVKGHMVRPKGIHVANKICFTLAGGEQTYNLGKYLISAEWVSEVKPKLAQQILQTQVDFYSKLAGQSLVITFEEAGVLGEDVAAKNKAILEKMGFSV